jgi:hypothetical protein
MTTNTIRDSFSITLKAAYESREIVEFRAEHPEGATWYQLADDFLAGLNAIGYAVAAQALADYYDEGVTKP